jgi:hypothetical protein
LFQHPRLILGTVTPEVPRDDRVGDLVALVAHPNVVQVPLADRRKFSGIRLRGIGPDGSSHPEEDRPRAATRSGDDDGRVSAAGSGHTELALARRLIRGPGTGNEPGRVELSLPSAQRGVVGSLRDAAIRRHGRLEERRDHESPRPPSKRLNIAPGPVLGRPAAEVVEDRARLEAGQHRGRRGRTLAKVQSCVDRGHGPIPRPAFLG